MSVVILLVYMILFKRWADSVSHTLDNANGNLDK